MPLYFTTVRFVSKFGDIGTDGRIILEWISRHRFSYKGVKKIHVAQGCNEWWVLVSIVMKLCVSYKHGISWLDERC
jgi:hypothetical protein